MLIQENNNIYEIYSFNYDGCNGRNWGKFNHLKNFVKYQGRDTILYKL